MASAKKKIEALDAEIEEFAKQIIAVLDSLIQKFEQIKENIMSGIRTEIEARTWSIFDSMIWKKNTFGKIDINEDSIEETEPTIEIQTTIAAAENTTEPANSATEEITVLATEAATEPPATEAPTETVPEPTEVVTMSPAETELEELLTEEQQNSILHQ